MTDMKKPSAETKTAVVIDRTSTFPSQTDHRRRAPHIQLEDPVSLAALHTVADLVALAYQRYGKIQRVPVNPAADPVNGDLLFGENGAFMDFYE
jgi:hypothetical protein